MGVNNLGVLTYLRSLSNYKDHKPVISLSSEVFQEYYDYYIVNGYLFIVGVQEVVNVDAKAIFSLTMVNPKLIVGIFTDEELNPDVSKISEVESGDWDKALKDIFERTGSGACNHGIPYTSMKLCVQDRVFNINDTVKCSDSLFSVNNPMLDAVNFARPGSQGEVYSGKCFVSSYDMVETITMPLNGVLKTPVKDYIDDDIKTLITTYLGNLGIANGRPWKKNTSYHKGENIWVNVETEDKDGNKTTAKRYFVSKIEGNFYEPINKNAWIETDANGKELEA